MLSKRQWLGRWRAGIIGLCVVGLCIGGVVFFKMGEKEQEVIVPQAPQECLRSELTLRDGVLYAQSESVPFNGVLYENFPGGCRKLEVTISEGRAHGSSVGYFENGGKEVEEFFVAGVSHGIRIRWDAEGHKISEEPIQDGQLNGEFVKWYPNGQEAVRMKWIHGEPEGQALAWYSDGSLKSRAKFEKGELVERKFHPPKKH